MPEEGTAKQFLIEKSGRHAIVRSIVKCNAEGKVPIVIMNLSDKKLVIGKKARLGQITPVQKTIEGKEQEAGIFSVEESQDKCSPSGKAQIVDQRLTEEQKESLCKHIDKNENKSLL